MIAVDLHVHPKLPTTKAGCKDSGWQDYSSNPDAPMCKNQGDCVSGAAPLAGGSAPRFCAAGSGGR